jgi:hypothetical protein
MEIQKALELELLWVGKWDELLVVSWAWRCE